MTTSVNRNDERSRYELLIDGTMQGFVNFAMQVGDPPVVHISHAEVAADLRGKGISEPMVRAALDDVRSQGALVVSTCGYVSALLDRYGEYADLIQR